MRKITLDWLHISFASRLLFPPLPEPAESVSQFLLSMTVWWRGRRGFLWACRVIPGCPGIWSLGRTRLLLWLSRIMTLQVWIIDYIIVPDIVLREFRGHNYRFCRCHLQQWYTLCAREPSNDQFQCSTAPLYLLSHFVHPTRAWCIQPHHKELYEL